MNPESPLQRFTARFVPAVLTALGVTFLAAGLLGLGDAADAAATATDLPPASATIPVPTATGPTLPPLATPGATATPAPTAPGRLATRIVIRSMQIDLPVIEGPPGYPPCNVAMYLKELGQPGEPRATYIYAHARKGMFLPLLDASKVSNGRSMLGKIVEVYTSDDRLYLYEISEVRRHQRELTGALEATTEQLWIQTSEGPNHTYPKLMVVAMPISSGPAPDPADAHPKARPKAC